MNYLAMNRQLKIKFDLPNEAFLKNIISNAIMNTLVFWIVMNI
jgi:hypothetical protein